MPCKRQYGIVRLHDGHKSWVGGTYCDGWITADINELGDYTLAQDTVPPVITPINPATWVGKHAITLRLSDNLSGIKTYRGEIDGAFALFEMNSKGVVTYRFDSERIGRGEHTLKLTASDACGNSSVYTHTFVW